MSDPSYVVNRDVTVAVAPADHRHAPLLRALARALPVTFVDLDGPAALSGCAGAILLAPDPAAAEAMARAGVPAYIVDADPDRPLPGASGGAVAVTFGSGPDTPAVLRRRTLSEHQAKVGVRHRDGMTTLAAVGQVPVWTVDAGPTPTHRVAEAPPTLDGATFLGHHLRPGTFLGLLPLVHFLRTIAGPALWDAPPVRACIVIDDPSFTTMSYGWIDYRQLVDQARRRRFHVSVATVPLDAALTRRHPRDLVARSADVLSVSVHGNDHLRYELGQDLDVARYRQMLAQALQRMDRAERQGLPYDRVQVPPHNLCSAAAATAMASLGYEGVSVTASYWSQLQAYLPLTGPTSTGWTDPVLLGGWCPADLTPDGLPVLIRHHLRDSRDDLWLNAFLGRPIVLYGHHEDLRPEHDLLTAAADEVNAGFDDVRWLSLAGLSRTNLSTRRHGRRLHVRPWSRRVVVDVPAGVDELVIDLPPDHPVGDRVQVLVDGRQVALTASPRSLASGPVPVGEGSTVEVKLHSGDLTDHWSASTPRSSSWSVARRALVHARDRSRPRMAKLRSRAS